MAHTLAAVFDNRADADRARAELMASGYDNTRVQLSDSSITAAGGNADASDDSIGGSIKNFFSNLFSDDSSVYSEAVNRGKVVLTVQADSDDEIERAADIVDRYDPIDIDEQESQWRASGWNASSTQAGVHTQNLQSAGLQSSTLSSTQSAQATQAGSLQGGTQAQSSMQYANTEAQQTIPVVEEELRVGKRVVQRGGVRIFQRLVETPVQENVTLREEHVKVERHPVNQPVDPSRIDAFKEGTVELREMAEEAVVQKTARVVEEVVVGKQVTQRQDQISDTVRRTEVDIEQLGAADDDTYYRSHWTSNYASLGGAYEDYEPAYRYGSAMRSSTSYQNRSWDDAETTLRSDWETRYPQSAWEKFKAAIRHGWDRITS